MEKLQAQALDCRDDPPAIMALKKMRNMEITHIIFQVAAAMDIPENIIRSSGRHGNDARAMAMFLARKHCNEMNVTIGTEFGGISGAAVTQMLQRVKERLHHDRSFADLLERIEQNLILKG